MKLLVVNQADVARLLPMPECIEAMVEALEATARGEVLLPLRHVVPLPNHLGAIASMPVYSQALSAVGVKVICVFPGNRGSEFDSHQGAVLLFEGVHGSLKAVVDASEVTAIRTAAVSGVATRLLAREDAAELAILGSGVQARVHLEAMLQVRKIKRVRVWSPTPAHVRAFAELEAKRHDVAIVAAGSAHGAVEGADIICTTTSARTPVLQGAWLEPGVHINAVGSSVKSTRELDGDAMTKALLFVDRRESTLNEAGDFLLAKAEGKIGDDHIRGEIGDLLLGRVTGRVARDDITLFKSLGLAVEDLAAVQHVYDKAVAEGAGTWVELGGSRRDA
jgi:ornithine cyclodeaminase/alanine dehydrogenase-like protein (mu-crystallin family)